MAYVKPWADFLTPRAKKEHCSFFRQCQETVSEVRALSKGGEGGRGYRHLQTSLAQEIVLRSMPKQMGTAPGFDCSQLNGMDSKVEFL